jgi:prevent-host-death family protein
MSDTANVRQLRANLGRYLNEVEFGGKRITVERRGKPAAVLVPLADLLVLEQAERAGKKGGR